MKKRCEKHPSPFRDNYPAGVKGAIVAMLLCFCLGAKAQSPILSSNVGMTLYTSNYLGTTGTALLDTGSSTFGTDYTTQLQAMLDMAKYGPITIVWDGKYSCTGLKIRSNTTIKAMQGCGAILRDASNNFLISSYIFRNDTVGNHDITIDGGIWNADGWRGGVAKQIQSDSTHGMMVGMAWGGVKNLSLLNVTIRNARCYGMLGMTMYHTYIDNLYVDQGDGAGLNQDGFDFIGHNSDFTLKNSRFKTGDDRIAFGANSAGGVAFGENHYPYLGANGDQTNITIDNITFMTNSDSVTSNGMGFRFNCSANKIENVHISNVSGKSKSYWLVAENLDNLTGYIFLPGPGYMRNFTFDHINVRCEGHYSYINPFPSLGEAILGCNITDITFTDIQRDTLVDAIPTFCVHNSSIVISNLTINEYNSLEIAGNTSISHIYIASGDVASLTVSNAKVRKLNDTAGTALIGVASGAICNKIIANGNWLYNIRYVLNNAGSVNDINAYGIFQQAGHTAAFATTNAVDSISFSNYIGQTASSGTFTSKSGDVFSSSFYTTIQSAGSAKTQRNNTNFLAPFTATDNSGNNSTDIGLGTIGISNGGTGATSFSGGQYSIWYSGTTSGLSSSTFLYNYTNNNLIVGGTAVSALGVSETVSIHSKSGNNFPLTLLGDATNTDKTSMYVSHYDDANHHIQFNAYGSSFSGNSNEPKGGGYALRINDLTGYPFNLYTSSATSNSIFISAGNTTWSTGGSSVPDATNIYMTGGSLTAIGTTNTPTSTLMVGGSFAKNIVVKSTSYTLTATDCTVKVTATGQTITLPTAVGCTGREYTIKLTASGSSTIATTSSQTIDGSTTYSLSAQYKYVTVQSDNANWIIIANN